jgi:hypothetical protein
MPLTARISETGGRIRDWLHTLVVESNDEGNKLQLTKWDLKNGEFHYQYSIIRKKELSAHKVSRQTLDSELEFSDIAGTKLQSVGELADSSPDL